MGEAKLQAGAVTSGKVVDDTVHGGGLHGEDIAADAIAGGEVLDFGLSNEDVGVLFAQVNGEGGVVNSSADGVTGTRLDEGAYVVDFAHDVSACAFVATQGHPNGDYAVAGPSVRPTPPGTSRPCSVSTARRAGRPPTSRSSSSWSASPGRTADQSSTGRRCWRCRPRAS